MNVTKPTSTPALLHVILQREASGSFESVPYQGQREWIALLACEGRNGCAGRGGLKTIQPPLKSVLSSGILAGQAKNRYRGTQAELQFSIVAPHTAHSKLLISRDSAMCSLRS
jgi:hypothetical protein